MMREPYEISPLAKLLVNTFVIAAAASIPSLLFAAWYFDNPNLAWWAVVPFILFMAG